MKSSLALIFKSLLVAILLPALLLSYQNCTKSAEDGNGQPYGGMRSFFHVNNSENTDSASTSTLPLGSSFAQKNTLSDTCLFDSRIDLVNNTYFLFDKLCNSQTTPPLAKEISSDSIKRYETVPLLNYNSALWQEATTQDLANPSFVWYLNACSNARGVYFDMQSPDLSSTYANVQVLKYNKDLGSLQNEMVKVILKSGNLQYAEVVFDFDSVEKKVTTVDLGGGQYERTTVRIGTSTKSNSSLMFKTVDTMMMGNLGMHESYLLMKELTPASGAQLKVYYDDSLFCM